MVSGVAGKPITIIGAGSSSNMTQVSGGGVAFGIWIDADYVNIKNFNVTAPKNWSGIYESANHHNVMIGENVVHGAGVDGIATYADDYITISHNTVYGNSTYTAGGIYGSGISVLGSLDIDAKTSVKVNISNNVVYSNTNIPTCPSTGCTSANQDSDGSGIIIDNSRRTYWDNIAYHGRTLISNNIIFGNGGRGTHVYLSDHVTIEENTMYYNNQDPYEGNYLPGEVEVNQGSDVAIFNNILYSDGGTGIDSGVNTGHHVGISLQHCTSGTKAMYAENNVVYNPANNSQLLYAAWDNTVTATVLKNTWSDPLLNNPSLDTSVANFRPRSGSVTVGTASSAYVTAADILNLTRTTPGTIGAYRSTLN